MPDFWLGFLIGAADTAALIVLLLKLRDKGDF